MFEFLGSQIILFVILYSSTYLFKYAATKDINNIIGYRTTRSSSSFKHWLLANNLCAIYTKYFALANLIFGIVVFIAFYSKLIMYEDIYSYSIAIQIVITFVYIYFSIEKQLKKLS